MIPGDICVCTTVQVRYQQVVSLGVQRPGDLGIGGRRKLSEKRKRRNSLSCVWCLGWLPSSWQWGDLYIHWVYSTSEMSVGHLPVAFVIEIFSHEVLEHGHPGLISSAPGWKVGRPVSQASHPTTLWLLCPSRLRPSWLLAGCLDCWELMCPQHSLEMHIQFSSPQSLAGLQGMDLVRAKQRATPVLTWGRRWPMICRQDDMLFQRSASAPALSFRHR